MRISVVIPLFNKEKSIRRAVKSVISQNYPPYEVIVINDGSTDDGARVVRRISDNRIRIIDQTNQGVSAARNRGLAEARSEHICLLDADDAWKQGFIKEIVKLISSFPDAVVYSVRHQRISEESKAFESRIGLPDDFFGVVRSFPDVYRKGYGLINSSSVCIKRSLYENGHTFPVGEIKGEDIYYWLRAAQLGDIAFSNKTLSTIYMDSENRGVSHGISLPYHIKWYLSDYDRIIQEKNGKEICKFILHNALIHVYGNVASNDRRMSWTIIKAFIKAGDIRTCQLMPSLIIPSRLMQVIRRLRRSLRKSRTH